jgi:hypothetical protein
MQSHGAPQSAAWLSVKTLRPHAIKDLGKF